MLVGNKFDLADERTVAAETGFNEALKWGAGMSYTIPILQLLLSVRSLISSVGFMEASAKSATNVDLLYYELIKLIERNNKKQAATKKQSSSKSLLRGRKVKNTCVIL